MLFCGAAAPDQALLGLCYSSVSLRVASFSLLYPRAQVRMQPLLLPWRNSPRKVPAARMVPLCPALALLGGSLQPGRTCTLGCCAQASSACQVLLAPRAWGMGRRGLWMETQAAGEGVLEEGFRALLEARNTPSGKFPFSWAKTLKHKCRQPVQSSCPSPSCPKPSHTIPLQ